MTPDRKRSDGERRDDGFTTVFLLGLTIALFVVAGLGLDLWRVVSERRAFAEAADAAARAGANAIDLDAFDESGVLVLDRGLAEQYALDNLGRQEVIAEGDLERLGISVAPDEVTVSIVGHVDTTLLRLLGFSQLDFSVESDASPRLSSPTAPPPD